MDRDRGPFGRRAGPHQNESGSNSAAGCSSEAIRKTDGNNVDDDHARCYGYSGSDSRGEHDTSCCSSLTISGCIEPHTRCESQCDAGRRGDRHRQSAPCRQSQRDSDCETSGNRECDTGFASQRDPDCEAGGRC
jgi:hypothetical protein